MTTLALRSRSAQGPAVAGPLLPGPLPAWAALYLNVLTFMGAGFLVLYRMPSVSRSPRDGAGGAGACPSGQPTHGGATEHLLDAAHGDGRPRADGEHSQRVPVRLDVPCRSFDPLRRRPLAAHAVVASITGETEQTACSDISDVSRNCCKSSRLLPGEAMNAARFSRGSGCPYGKGRDYHGALRRELHLCEFGAAVDEYDGAVGRAEADR